MRCPRCGGNRRVMSVGFMEADCPLCKGIGIVPDSVKPAMKTETLTQSLEGLMSPEAGNAATNKRKQAAKRVADDKA